ncbi:MAG: hypothetical protein K1X57_17055 [Gemmataceae bacterium]|nr:hypothetical protein [Gemmataceae bacterium]
MAMKLLPFHNERVADLPTDDQDDNLITLHIVQRPQVAHPQFELGQRVGAKLFDRFRECFRLILQSGQDRRLHNALFAGGQVTELPFGVARD